MSEAKPAEAAEEAEGVEGADGQDAAAPPPNRRRKLLLIGLLLLLLVGGGGGTAWWLLGSDKGEEEEVVAETPEAFVDVPAMQVSLRAADGGSRFLKLHIMLVPGKRSIEEITPRLPLLVDRFQPFLRELRPEDLSGSAATFRIKEELLIRSNQALGSGAVRDVLIQDLMQG